MWQIESCNFNKSKVWFIHSNPSNAQDVQYLWKNLTINVMCTVSPELDAPIDGWHDTKEQAEETLRKYNENLQTTTNAADDD